MKGVKWWSSYIVIARRERSEGRGNPSCLGGREGFVCSGNEGQWIATGYALAMTIIGEEERSELIFHPFTLPSLAFLQTNPEAKVVVTIAGTGVVTLSRT